MANQILARLGIVMGVDSGELEIGLAAAKEKFKGFTREVTRQSTEAAKMTMAMNMEMQSYGKTLTNVERVELELKSGRLAGNMVSEKQLKLLRDTAAAYDAIKVAATKANTTQAGGGLSNWQKQQVAYQTTDTVTSLMGGQNPLMVLMQQGGQLKDQFGGLGPMFRALGTYITPVGVAVTALGVSILGSAYAMYKGAAEQKEFVNSLVITGHYLNITEGQFSLLARTVSDKYHTSLSGIREAMQAVASTGQFTATSFNSVTEVVARMSKLTGEAASTIATSLLPSLDGSASSAKRLNDQYHFLSVAQYEQIRQLAAQGKLQESIKITSDALTVSLNKQTRDIGYLGSAWESVAKWAGVAVQAMKDWGKTSTPDEKVTKAWQDYARKKFTAERDNATELQVLEMNKAKAIYENEVLLRGQKLASDALASAEAENNQNKIDDIASGRAAKRRQKMYQADDLDEQARAYSKILSNDKVSSIEEKRVADMLKAISSMKRMNQDEDGAYAESNARLLSAQLININAKAAQETADIYAKAKEGYRLTAQSEQDVIDKEKERIAFYKEHIFLQGADLEIALSRLKTEQEIAAIYSKKDGGLKSDKDAAAERLRDIQKQREAVIEQGAHLKMLQDMNQSVYSNMGSAIDTFVRTGKFAFKDFARSVIQDLIAIAMKAQMMAMFKGFSFFGAGGGGGTTGQFESDINTSGFSGLATGGSVVGGTTYMVGENGPELFTSNTSGTITPNGQMSSSSNNQPQVVYNGPYIASMSAIDTQSATQFLAKNKQTIWAVNQSAQRSLPVSR